VKKKKTRWEKEWSVFGVTHKAMALLLLSVLRWRGRRGGEGRAGVGGCQHPPTHLSSLPSLISRHTQEKKNKDEGKNSCPSFFFFSSPRGLNPARDALGPGTSHHTHSKKKARQKKERMEKE
jgi:hypothetical protein